ncbi:hypothetical protein HOY82DRAFT_567288 [Tuber indicum]|nr:hypothetical protein HOY82DRAFT_567288 [Tuber indicum]
MRLWRSLLLLIPFAATISIPKIIIFLLFSPPAGITRVSYHTYYYTNGHIATLSILPPFSVSAGMFTFKTFRPVVAWYVVIGSSASMILYRYDTAVSLEIGRWPSSEGVCCVFLWHLRLHHCIPTNLAR